MAYLVSGGKAELGVRNPEFSVLALITLSPYPICLLL